MISKTPSPSCRYSEKAFCYSDVFSYCYVELIKGFISATALLVLKFTAQVLRFFLILQLMSQNRLHNIPYINVEGSEYTLK